MEREIKFRQAIFKNGRFFTFWEWGLIKGRYHIPFEPLSSFPEGIEIKPSQQYTGLKDKNGLLNIYEGDILGVDGIIRGNKYENPSLLQDSTNLVIEGFGTKTWCFTYKEAMDKGCKDSE